MKRTIFFLVMILLTVLLFSVAEADALFQTDRFEITLSDAWQCKSCNDSYVTANRVVNGIETGSFGIFETKNQKWPDDPESLAATIMSEFSSYKEPYEWQEIEIAGFKTVLIESDSKAGRFCFTAIPSGNYHATIMFFERPGYVNHDDMVKQLNSLTVRNSEDIGFFRFGDAEVKFVSYAVKKVGTDRLLLLDFEWRNVGAIASRFVLNVSATAYQDGIELKEGYLFTENSETGTSIMPGKSIKCTEVFVLRSATGEISLYLDKLMDVLDEYPNREYLFTLK